MTECYKTSINSINIELFELTYYQGGPEWNFSHVNSPFNRLYFMLDGQGTVENAFGHFVLEPGHVYLIPLHTTNSFKCSSRIDKFYVHVRVELSPGFDVFEAADTCPSLPFDPGMIRDMVRMSQSGKLEDMFRLKSIIFEVCARFSALFSDQIEDKFKTASQYTEIHRHIKKHCGADLTVAAIAHCFNLSTTALARRYKRDMGITLKKTIDIMILQSAKELLLLSDGSVKEIAYQLRFSDEFYFSRFIKKHTGVAPREYRFRNRMEYR